MLEGSERDHVFYTVILDIADVAAAIVRMCAEEK